MQQAQKPCTASQTLNAHEHLRYLSQNDLSKVNKLPILVTSKAIGRNAHRPLLRLVRLVTYVFEASDPC
jgi:hypothetical protein